MTARTAAAWAIMTIFFAATRAAELLMNGRVVHRSFDLTDAGVIAGLLAASAVHAAVVVWLMTRSRVADPARIVAVVLLGLGFTGVNDIEAVVFRIAPVAPLLALGALGVVVHAIATAGVARFVPAASGETRYITSPFAEQMAFGVVRRVVLLSLLYAIIYFAAGSAIYPFVRDFYATRPLPPAGAVFGLQLAVRGPLFVAIGAIVIWLLRSTRGAHAAAVACTLAGLGGLAALLVPNPLFPDAVRLVHLIEVGVSNSVFGWIVGWVMTGARASRRSASPAVASG